MRFSELLDVIGVLLTDLKTSVTFVESDKWIRGAQQDFTAYVLRARHYQDSEVIQRLVHNREFEAARRNLTTVAAYYLLAAESIKGLEDAELTRDSKRSRTAKSS